MKTFLVLSTLLPAGFLAAFFSSSAARQEAVVEPQEQAYEYRIVQTTEPEGIVRVQETPGVPALMPTQARGAKTVRAFAGSPGTWSVQTPTPPVAGAHGPTAFTFAFGHGGGNERTHKALAKLRKAESDDDKAEAREELQAALGEEFDEYLKHQADELERMEEKLAKLRKQLDKRRDAKDKLVALKLETLENEVDGLGWPGGSGGGTLFTPGMAPLGSANFDTEFSLSTPAVIAAPMTVPAVAPPAEPEDEDEEETEKEKSSERQPRARRGAR